MKVFSSHTTERSKIAAYNRSMAKPRKELERPAQGRRLMELRKAAGLSQYELAEMIGESQPNIAYWELSDKPPRSDVLHKLADALGVSIPELLSVNVRTAAVSNSNRPAGKLRQLFNDVSRLPRRQQEHIVRWVSAFVRQYEEEQR
jgi:transcriptional regulator with XRE-family HTH domain